MHKYSMWSQFRLGHTYMYHCALNAQTYTCTQTGCLRDKFTFKVFKQNRKQRMKSVNFLRFCDITLYNDSPRRCCRTENLSFEGRPRFMRRSLPFLLITRSQNFSLYKQTNWIETGCFWTYCDFGYCEQTDLFTHCFLVRWMKLSLQ